MMMSLVEFHFVEYKKLHQLEQMKQKISQKENLMQRISWCKLICDENLFIENYWKNEKQSKLWLCDKNLTSLLPLSIKFRQLH